MALAEVRLESGAVLAGGGGGGGAAPSLPPCSLLAPSGLRCAPDGEQALRMHRRRVLSRSATRIQVVRAARDERDDAKIGTRKLFKLPGTLKIRRKDTNLVFVAGATGNVGSRTVKELVKAGLRVRAGVRSVDKAELVLGETVSFITSSSPLEKILAFFGLKQEDRLQIIDCDLEKSDDIELAIGNAGIVICAIGASEKEILDVTGPYRIDFEATKNLIAAAKNAEVKHFILVTSLGTTKFGFPASVLNLFWGVLIWKAKAEKALVDSGLSYTIVRPGGMERPTDAFKETHNLRLAPKDTFSGGQISRLQVAELLACIASNPDLAEDKILEAIAETSAPLRPIEELLKEIPSQSKEEEEEPVRTASSRTAEKRKGPAEASTKGEANRKTELSTQKEAQEETKRKAAEAKKAQEEAKRRTLEAKKSQELRQKVAAELSDLKQKEAAAALEAESIQKKRAELAKKAQEAAAEAAQAEAMAKALLTAAKQGKVLSEADKRKVLEAESKRVLQPPKISMKTAAPERPVASKKVPVQSRAEEDKVPVVDNPAPKAKNTGKLSPSKKAPEAAAVPKKSETKTSEKLESTSNNPAKGEEPAKAVKITDKPEQAEKGGTVKPDEEKEPEPAPVAKAMNEQTETGSKQSEPALINKPEVRKPFRWFWEQDETATAASRPVETEAAAPETDTPAAESTLSPYPTYSDLKPPSSPTPEAPKTRSKGPEIPPEKKAEVGGTAEQSSREREEAALSKAQSSLAFRWPWGNKEASEPPSSNVQGASEKADAEKAGVAAVAEAPTSSVETDETIEDGAKKEDSEKSKEVTGAEASEVPSNETQEETGKATEAGDNSNGSPLSATPSEPVKAIEANAVTDPPAEEEVVQGDKDKPTGASQFDAEKAKARELESLAKAKAANSFIWFFGKKSEPAKEKAETTEEKNAPPISSSEPISSYPNYPDWKPAAPPTPPRSASSQKSQKSQVEPIQEKSAVPPTSSQKSEVEPVQSLEKTAAADKEEVEKFTSSSVKEREQAALDKARAALSWRWKETTEVVNINSDRSQSVTPPSRPLSPYYRYEDLKPPVSPTPKPPSPVQASTPTQEKRTPQTSSASAGDNLPSDVVDEAAQEAKARAARALEQAKSSIAVKWPWSS